MIVRKGVYTDNRSGAGTTLLQHVMLVESNHKHTLQNKNCKVQISTVMLTCRMASVRVKAAVNVAMPKGCEVEKDHGMMRT